jgi:hypothetical protein
MIPPLTAAERQCRLICLAGVYVSTGTPSYALDGREVSAQLLDTERARDEAEYERWACDCPDCGGVP